MLVPLKAALFQRRHRECVRILLIIACLASCRRGRAAIRKVCGSSAEVQNKVQLMFFVLFFCFFESTLRVSPLVIDHPTALQQYPSTTRLLYSYGKVSKFQCFEVDIAQLRHTQRTAVLQRYRQKCDETRRFSSPNNRQH